MKTKRVLVEVEVPVGILETEAPENGGWEPSCELFVWMWIPFEADQIKTVRKELRNAA